MYIGRLQLKGFKSFGGAHDLIMSPGFTAIVGPNGSGKSNLLDALRWALGDSSASRLRISRQSDLLFQGASSLPPAKEGEVVLQLRDELQTTIIKRKVTAPDGATSLFVDGARKTLAELEEIKSSWNLDGDRFAFIGQGEVSEAIQERPAERRKRLEALFGTEVYRKRRMSAADRLAGVKEEYNQLRTFTAELNSRREEIAPEVARASKLREIMDSIEDDRRLLYWMRRAGAEAELLRLTSEIERAEQAEQAFKAWINIWKLSFEKAEKDLSAAADKRKEHTWELEQCRTRFESLTKSGVASATNLRSSKARLSQAMEDLFKAQERDKKLEKEQTANEKESKAANDALKKSRDALAEVEAKWTEYNKRIEEQKEEREALSARRGEIEAEIQKAEAKIEFLSKDLEEAKTQKETNKDPRKDIDGEIKKTTEARDKLLAEQEELRKKHGVLYARVQNLAGEVQRARREAAHARSKLNEVTDALQSELYPRPVQYLLSASKLNRLDAAPRAVIDVFTCDTKLSAAFEAFLGARQFQLLVEDLEEAGRCIDKLKANSAGRATFLPLERCRPRFPNYDFKLPADGIVGWAIDLVQVEEHWLPAIRQIIGDVLIVRDYAVGQQIVRSGFKSPVVTMEGDVFQPGGTVSGGRSQRSGRTIEMKAQAAKLEKIAKDAIAASEKLNAEFKKCESEEIAASDQAEKYTRQIREYDGRIALLEDQKEKYAKEQKRLENEKERLTAAIKDEEQKIKQLLAQRDEVDQKWDEQGDVEDDRQLIEERERLRADVALAAERTSSKFVLMERISNDIRMEKIKIAELEGEIASLDFKCVSERAALAQVGKECLSIHNRKAALIAEMDKYVEGYSALEKKRKVTSARLQAAELRLRTGMHKFSATQSKKEAAEKEIEEMTNSWEEKYPYPGAAALPDNVNLEELRRKIRDGDRKIKAYGNVDMGVLSENKNLEDRLKFMGEHLDDVKKSAEELEKLIADADSKAMQIFTDALQKVDERFCSIFQRLFGGGEAHLEMTDSATIWETGVDVIARPPGKHPHSINQLSGGEQSLAAISLLFASMEVAGCPLAVLDEVDAALDEVNLRRFSELTKEYAKNRQILAMTHRRVTMERADLLYGVTLSEPGLSQVVGVKMEDWA